MYSADFICLSSSSCIGRNNMHVRGFAGNVHIICAQTLWVNVHTKTHNTLQNS